MKIINILVRAFLYALFGLVLFSAGVTVLNWRYWAAMGILMAVDILSYIKGAWDAT